MFFLFSRTQICDFLDSIWLFIELNLVLNLITGTEMFKLTIFDDHKNKN